MITKQPDQITSPGQTKRNRNRKCHRTLPVVPVMMMMVVNRFFKRKDFDFFKEKNKLLENFLKKNQHLIPKKGLFSE